MGAHAIDTDAFANAETRQFEQALVAARKARDFAANMPVLLRALSESMMLGSREQDRRASLMMSSIVLDDATAKAIAILAQGLVPSVRNAVTRALPAEYRQLAFDQSMTEPRQAAQAPRSDTAIHPPPQEDAGKGLVLLVGTPQEHEHNLQVLAREKIEVIRAKTPQDVEALLTDGVVGIILARSCWTAISAGGHRAFLEKVCRFSSFVFVKADSTGFSDPADFDRTCSIARCRGLGMSEVRHGDSCNIAETDLPRLISACSVLADRKGIQLYPIDIPPNTARMLIASVGTHVDHRQFPNAVHLKTIGTKTMQGGKSEALLVQAHPDDEGPPLIIKVASLPLLRDEIERFTSFIKPWDAVLHPQLHFHGEDGLIVFGLVEDPDHPRTPAPTIEDQFQQTLRAETGNPTPALSREELVALVDRTVHKVADLNRRQCRIATFASLAWMTLEPVDEALIES